MKFSPKEDIRKDRNVFEAGNSYESSKYSVPDEDVIRWYNNGLTEIEGKDPCGERKTTPTAINVQNGQIGQSTT